MKTPTEPLYDCLKINIASRRVSIMDTNKSLRNAEAYCMMAAARHGVETHFYSESAAGTYQGGEPWTGKREARAKATAP